MVKSAYGTLVTRLLSGGVTLSALEAAVFDRMVGCLPAELKDPLLGQLNEYNLVQREVDGRALNFYKKEAGRVTRAGLPELPLKPGEVLLLKMTFTVPGQDQSFHATMTAVDKRFFCLNFSHDLRPFRNAKEIKVQDIKQSWRSNVVGVQQGVPADGSRPAGEPRR